MDENFLENNSNEQNSILDRFKFNNSIETKSKLMKLLKKKIQIYNHKKTSSSSIGTNTTAVIKYLEYDVKFCNKKDKYYLESNEMVVLLKL